MSEDRRPTVTLNTATDRDIAHERGLLIAYLDTAYDALLHVYDRTNAGRAWLLPDDVLEDQMDRLHRLRDEVLRKEKTDSQNARTETQRADRGVGETQYERRWQ